MASTQRPIVIGWGRKDRVCLPRQAARAMQRFPSARLHWFERSGHFPHWDAPEETVRLVLETTGDRPALAASERVALSLKQDAAAAVAVVMRGA